MQFLSIAKDGGKDSNATGYWLFEIKGLCSIVLLCFEKGTREAYHNHAFNAWSWILKGKLYEEVLDSEPTWITPSWKPLFTGKGRFHKVHGIADKTWALSFRGPWDKTWKEYFKSTNKFVTLTNGRKVLNVV